MTAGPDPGRADCETRSEGENPGPERPVVYARTNAGGALDYHAPAAPVSVTPALWAERE
jgi:hypothetical protein